jgi:lipopolysaccharide transport system ATP-binding protein
MSQGPLCVYNLGKAYRDYGSEWRRVVSWFGVSIAPRKVHWVLRHVSFKLAPGEAVGIIGQNGAGKSTLLKLITGTIRPTEGNVEVNGRIAAILELGLGFNPEFTGRQNVYHAAGLMGFSRTQIDYAMPAIEDFTEIGEYFDQPIRMYSSGMQVRLAFSAITAYRPEILIIDEALTVGDAYFQHKCAERIRGFVAQGTSLLFVSHDLGTVKKLCVKALLLEGGTLAMEGSPDQVVDYYNAMLSKKEEECFGIEQKRLKDGWLRTRSGTSEACVLSIQLVDAVTGEKIALARVGNRVRLQVNIEVRADIPRLVLGVMLRDRTGHVIWGTNTWHTGQMIEGVSAGERIRFEIEFPMLLGPGSYSVSPALTSTDTHLIDNYEWIDNFFVFEVVNTDRPYFIGSTWLNSVWHIHRRQVADLHDNKETVK